MTSLQAKALACGVRLTIWGVVDEGGVCEAEDFLRALDMPAQTKFQARFERLTAVGYLRSPDEMRRLQVAGSPEVQEIKVNHGPGYRLYVIRHGLDWLATHGAKRPKDKNVPTEVAKARKLAEAAGL